MRSIFRRAGLVLFLAGLPDAASAAVAAQPPLDGSGLSLIWMLPFAGLLLSIALLPSLTPRFWHHHFGKVAAFWSLAFLLPCALARGVPVTLAALVHTLLVEYLPFVLLLLALFVVAGGVRLKAAFEATPVLNASTLAVGTLLASVAGTMGASVLLVRPLIEANLARRSRAHVFVFFILLVGNIGGALTPLGDPPLFLGFLAGVPFFWTTRHLLAPTLMTSAVLLLVFFILDSVLHAREIRPALRAESAGRKWGLEGMGNLLLLGGILGIVLMSGLWKPETRVMLLGTDLGLADFMRDGGLLLLALLSWLLTPRRIREANRFSWFPMQEVALVFGGIFITLIPALAILGAGSAGALAPFLAGLNGQSGGPNPALYFWLTGVISSLLDNAPTYLLAFNMAGGDPASLTGPLAGVLAAISAGAVYMGANSYIGNAPNLMIRAICQERGIRLPSFFGYIAWTAILLAPIYVALTLLFFRR